jgi:hypothetical protein
MTYDIFCEEHEKLSIDKNCYQIIHPEVWQYFCSLNYTGEPVPATTEPCIQCKEAEHQREEIKLARKTERDKLKKSMSDLWRPSYPKKVGVTYYVVDAKWAVEWRDFIDSPEKEELTSPLTNSEIVCPHNLLKFDVYKFFTEHYPKEDYVVLIGESSWKSLVEM